MSLFEELGISECIRTLQRSLFQLLLQQVVLRQHLEVLHVLLTIYAFR